MSEPSENSPTVFVIDDDDSVRDAIEGVVKSVGMHAATFACTRDFLGQWGSSHPGCLVLDVRLPGMSGLEFQHELIRAGIEIPIIFLSGYGDIPMTVRAMRSGAVEFLTKPFRDEDLLEAIGKAFKRDLEIRRRRSETTVLRQCFETLSARERQVMRLVASGRLNKQIAAELGTSEITVKIQRSHLMHKMGADSLAQLVRMADKLGIGSA